LLLTQAVDLIEEPPIGFLVGKVVSLDTATISILGLIRWFIWMMDEPNIYISTFFSRWLCTLIFLLCNYIDHVYKLAFSFSSKSDLNYSLFVQKCIFLVAKDNVLYWWVCWLMCFFSASLPQRQGGCQGQESGDSGALGHNLYGLKMMMGFVSSAIKPVAVQIWYSTEDDSRSAATE